MQQLVTKGLNALRKVAGDSSALEDRLRRTYWSSIRQISRGRRGPNYTIFGSRRPDAAQVGIYAYGSCDLPSILACKPMIARAFDGACCIQREGKVSHARTDLILQALDGAPVDATAAVRERLHLPDEVFQPRLFEPTIQVDANGHEREFSKDVIILSIAADVTRSLYRHRETGVLMDPGGGWLNQSVEFALRDPELIKWVQREFESVGRLPVEESMANYRRIIPELRNRTGAQVLLFNMLSVEPGTQVHNLQFVRQALMVRVKEFDMALWELADDLDVPVVDIDRLLKANGVGGLVDFAHDQNGLFPRSHYQPIAEEAFAIMRERGVFGKPGA